MPNRLARIRFLQTVALLTACFFATSCNYSHKQRLRVGLVVWPPYEIAFLAQSEGRFDDRIDLVDYWSPAVAVRDFRNGAIDVAVLTANYAIELGATSDDVRIILVIDESQGGDAIVARPDIGELADLRGKRVGVEASSLGAYILARGLSVGGLKPTDIEIVPMDIGDQEALFKLGELAAVTTYEPVRTRLLENGGHEIFNSNQMPLEILDVLVTNTAVIDESGELVQLLTDGWLDAVNSFNENPVRAAEVMALREEMDPKKFLQVISETADVYDREDNVRLLGPQKEILQPLQTILDRSFEAGLIKSRFDVTKLIDGRFVTKSGNR